MAKNIGTLISTAAAYQQRATESRLIESWTQDSAAEFQTIATRFLSEGKALQGREETIRLNRDLSPSGKFNDTKVAVQGWFGSLGWIKNRISALETKAGNNFGELYALPKSDANPVIQELRDQELRGEVRGLEPAERVRGYLIGCEQNDVELLRALLQGPGLTPLVPSEVRVRGLDLRASRLDPSRHKAFIEIGELLDLLHAIARESEDLAKEFGVDISKIGLTADELGPKIREVLDFAVEHQSRGTRSHAATLAEPVRQTVSA